MVASSVLVLSGSVADVNATGTRLACLWFIYEISRCGRTPGLRARGVTRFARDLDRASISRGFVLRNVTLL